MNRGGVRKNAGRPMIEDKKVLVGIYIKKSIVDKLTRKYIRDLFKSEFRKLVVI